MSKDPAPYNTRSNSDTRQACPACGSLNDVKHDTLRGLFFIECPNHGEQWANPPQWWIEQFTKHQTQPRFSVKELASEMGKHPSYVYAMRAKGFRMPGGTSTVTEALAWIEKQNFVTTYRNK